MPVVDALEVAAQQQATVLVAEDDTQIELYDPSLGTLTLGCNPYVVQSLQIGSPSVREVLRPRALASGIVDDSMFLGARAVTIAMRLKNYGAASCDSGEVWGDMQKLIDQVTPYMSPRIRPLLIYKLPQSTQLRAMVVRGVSWPVTVANPKFPAFTVQFICPSGEIYDGSGGAARTCIDITPATDVEEGRHYAAPEDAYGPYHTNAAGLVERAYPPGQPVGGRTITNPGSFTAHWELTIFGQTTNPTFRINDQFMEFDRNGGVDIIGGESLVIDTRNRTILYNGEPGLSRYDRSNYQEWTWDALKLRPGVNTVVFGAEALTDTSTARLCYRPVYL